MSWHRGQVVVAIESVTGGYGTTIIEGQHYTIRGVTACDCLTRLDVGVTPARFVDGTQCTRCRWTSGYDKTAWIPSIYFRPADPLQERLTELLEEAKQEATEPTLI